ncbi:MAG TPA: sugar phosphorylase [Anaerolineales bacterium]|jgi:sucrose phosphorylase
MNMTTMHPLLVQLYGEELGTSVLARIESILEQYRGQLPEPRAVGLSARDVVLITYPDQVQHPGQAPLAALMQFCRRRLAGLVSTVHVLPFYPSSSDDGFSVIDYRAVDPRYGEWKHVQELGKHFRLMFDAVINHVSVGSTWFQGLLQGDERYLDYFVLPGEGADLTKTVRPRALPLLTVFSTAHGERKIWTTFSPDQVDLNYQNPDVLLEIMDILLFYVLQGAEFIRLDAIAYLWKEPGTTSIHLPQTHWVIQLFRAALDEVAPHVILITETNVPHGENISYFGDGANEAQMVYNFSLPPLVLHAFHTGSADVLARWAGGLKLASDKVAFFNFLASHDGIGVNPLRGILPEAEIQSLAEMAAAHGGSVSMKASADGTQIPYELNINYFDALNDPRSGESVEIQIERFVTAHAILLAMRGVPALYFHSLVGSRGWPEGVALTGRARTINREKLALAQLDGELSDPDSLRSRVLTKLSRLLQARGGSPAFDPHADQSVLNFGKRIFAIARRTPSDELVLCLHNVSGDRCEIDLSTETRAEVSTGAESMMDLISGRRMPWLRPRTLELHPFQSVWLVRQ